MRRFPRTWNVFIYLTSKHKSKMKEISHLAPPWKWIFTSPTELEQLDVAMVGWPVLSAPEKKRQKYTWKCEGVLTFTLLLSGDPERVGASTILMPTALTYDASDAHLSRWQQTIEKSLKECEICSMLTEKKNKKDSLIRTHLHNSPSFALTDKASPLASKSKLPLSLICGLKPR